MQTDTTSHAARLLDVLKSPETPKRYRLDLINEIVRIESIERRAELFNRWGMAGDKEQGNEKPA